MHKQLTLIETENAGWQATDADKEAAKRGLCSFEEGFAGRPETPR